MSRELKSWWHSWQQRRTQRILTQSLDKTETQVRNLLYETTDEPIDSPVVYAESVFGIKPFPYQAELLEDENKRIVACMGRQTGKTTAIAMKAVFFADTHPNVTILITSPSLRQSMIMFDRVASLVFSTARLLNRVTRATRTMVQLVNGSRIIALPCSENLLRGYTVDMLICDEASWVPEEVITQVLFPMLSTTDGYAIFLSTPWDKNHFFRRAFVNPNYSVHKVKSKECPLIKPEFLKEMRENMTHEAYLMEYEAEFVEAVNSYFTQDLIRKCVELAQTLGADIYTSLEGQFPNGDYYAGVDFGKLQDYSVITVVKREKENLSLIYLHQFPLETLYTHVIGHLFRAHEKFRFNNVLVDQTGVGEPVLEEMHNQGMNLAEGLVFTTETKESLLTTLKIKMEQNRLAIPYDKQLCQQMNEQQCDYGKSGHLLFTHPPRGHDDMLWSLALAVYATAQTPLPGKGAIML